MLVLFKLTVHFISITTTPALPPPPPKKRKAEKEKKKPHKHYTILILQNYLTAAPQALSNIKVIQIFANFQYNHNRTCASNIRPVWHRLSGEHSTKPGDTSCTHKTQHPTDSMEQHIQHSSTHFTLHAVCSAHPLPVPLWPQTDNVTSCQQAVWTRKKKGYHRSSQDLA